MLTALLRHWEDEDPRVTSSGRVDGSSCTERKGIHHLPGSPELQNEPSSFHPDRSFPGGPALRAYRAVAAAQVPGEVADVSHVLGELVPVPAGRQLHLALQRPELRQQRPLAPPPGEHSRPGPPPAPAPAPAAAARQPPARAPAPAGPGRRSAAPPRGHVLAAAAARPRDAVPARGGRLQLVRPERAAAAGGAGIALEAQLAEEAAQGQHPVQLAGRQGLALQRAPAPPRRPGQQAAGAEDVPARRAQGLVQQPAAQPALQLRARGCEALQGEAHGSDRGSGDADAESTSSEHPCLPGVPLRQRPRCGPGCSEGSGGWGVARAGGEGWGCSLRVWREVFRLQLSPQAPPY